MAILSRLSVAAILLLGAATASCERTEGSAMTTARPYEYDSPLTERLQEFHRSGPHGAERPLAQLTNFDWDTVYLFSEGNTYRHIDTTVGTTVFGRDGRYVEQGSLLIFTSKGQVVHAVALVPPIIHGREHAYSRDDAVLRAITKDPGPYQLSFDESADAEKRP